MKHINETFKVKFKNGNIIVYGNPMSYEHIWYAEQKFKNHEIEPFLHQKIRFKIKRMIKQIFKFFKCLKYALTPTIVEVNRTPYLIKNTNRKAFENKIPNIK